MAAQAAVGRVSRGSLGPLVGSRGACCRGPQAGKLGGSWLAAARTAVEPERWRGPGAPRESGMGRRGGS